MEKEESGMMVIYAEAAKIPAPLDKIIWPRNYILKGISVKDGAGEGRHINIGSSVEHASKPIEGGINPAFVRATINHQSALVETDGAAGSILTEIRSMNPNGNFPIYAIKKIQEKSPKEKLFRVWSDIVNKKVKGEALTPISN